MDTVEKSKLRAQIASSSLSKFLFVDGRETDDVERLRDGGGEGGGDDTQESGSSAANQVL